MLSSSTMSTHFDLPQEQLSDDNYLLTVLSPTMQNDHYGDGLDSGVQSPNYGLAQPDEITGALT